MNTIATLWTLMRRELWEGPGSFKWTPIVLFGLTLFFMVFGLVLGSRFDNELAFTFDAIRQFAQLPDEQRSTLVTGALFASSALFFQILILVVIFYLSSCLYDERKDRSILFWKSLPVSDTMTVVSKLMTACILVPALYLAAIMLTQLSLLLIGSGYALMADVNPLNALWLPAALPKLWAVMIIGMLVQALWLLPIYAWLMFCSAWAPRVPILVAIAIPVGAALLQHTWSLLTSFSFPDFNIGMILLKRLGSGILPTNVNFRLQSDGGQMDFSNIQFGEGAFMSFSNSFAYLLRADMWVGILIAVILLAAAVWLRRRAADS